MFKNPRERFFTAQSVKQANFSASFKEFHSSPKGLLFTKEKNQISSPILGRFKISDNKGISE